uniref:Mitogen-activated protein kinase n=1 Tax=Rhizophora mucronata TaxID=61149 RepID=A0A2P2M935_RHIMU
MLSFKWNYWPTLTTIFFKMCKLCSKLFNSTWIKKISPLSPIYIVLEQLRMIFKYLSENKFPYVLLCYSSPLKLKLHLCYWLTGRLPLNFCQSLEVRVCQCLFSSWPVFWIKSKQPFQQTKCQPICIWKFLHKWHWLLFPHGC